MSPSPRRDTAPGRAYNDLRNLARRQGRDAAEYFSLYALEGFLARLAVSRYADHLVLKGGVLLAAFSARRPTRDIDLAASGFPNEITEAEECVRSTSLTRHCVKRWRIFGGHRRLGGGSDAEQVHSTLTRATAG